MNPPLLFVIDDDPVYRLVMKKMAITCGILEQVRFFEDGERAFRHFEEHYTTADQLPNLILLDLNMPYMDGWEFLDRFTDLYPLMAKPITTYIVSSSVAQGDRAKAERYETVRGFLSKPMTLARFRELFAALSYEV